MGRSSFSLEDRPTACVPGGTSRLVAVSEWILVRYNDTVGRPVPLSEVFATAIETYEGRALRGPSAG